MPTICFFCVLCGAALQVSSESADDLMECRSCARHVPVPRLANLLGRSRDYLPVLPPEILELTVKFRCTQCSSPLRADARTEGRGVTCPDCEGSTKVPRWSTALAWPPTVSKGSRAAPRPMPAMRMPIATEAAPLSVEEIDFLSGQIAKSPGAAV